MLRLERKYLVPNSLMENLRKRLMPFVRPDVYAQYNSNGGYPQYVVRSIYLDSKNLDCYIEKKEGVMLRRKFRIRGYGYPGDNDKVVFEIKRKIENRVKKNRAFVPIDKIDDILRTGDVEDYVLKDKRKHEVAIDDARRFFYHVKKNQFRPTVLIVYEREAYHGKFDPGVRITFDKNIRSLAYPMMSDLYNDDNLSYLFKSHFILEIKYFSNNMPIWAKSLIQEFRLRHEALSKYVIGFDSCHKNRHKTKA